MTDNVKKALSALRSCEYRKQRINNKDFDMTEIKDSIPPRMLHTVMLEKMLAAETPYILDERDIFGFNRRNIYTPYYYIPEKERPRRDWGGNITPSYRRIIEQGFDSVIEQIDRYAESADSEKAVFYEAMRRDVLAVLDISERYRVEAERVGNTRLATALARVPRKSATNFYEACLFFKIIIYTIRCAGFNHITLGRFDQYMYSYYKHDIDKGATREDLLEILELLFISLNVDSDIYVGVQQGDNGQSMVLGGFDKDGNDMFNALSSLCMDASLELSLIDPKINLRVGKKTPDWLYEYGTRLTKQGLGFPQYCNDDIAVPYLISVGYDEKDALDYTVAACWEFIVPNCAYDVPNKATMNFPLVVNRAIISHLEDTDSFDDLLGYVKEGIITECEALIKLHSPIYSRQEIIARSMYLSIFVDGCLEKGLDITQGGAKYNNYGSHGAGIANAADALMAVKKTVFEDKSIKASELLAALDANFVGYEEVRNKLISCPKMGNNDDSVDELASIIMDTFATYLNGKPNDVGGIWRAGTGSAMEYIRAAKQCPATADGRFSCEPFGCSFSPAITTRLRGPLSVIQSFTKYDMKKISNGGPLTMEIHDTVFRNEEGEKKVSALVKTFIHLGGHQLQLNSINRERLLEAQNDPDKYPNLIVRVWGWSGYFRELDREYQDHIIKRTEFSV